MDEAQSSNPQDTSAQEWQGLPDRINQVLSHAGLNQTDLARLLGLSSGFMSEVVRGVKRPGPDFFMGVRRLLGVSIDWLMTGEGTMTGGAGIRQDLFLAIRLQIAVVKSAIHDSDPLARALMLLIREGHVAEATADKAFSALLERIAPADADLDLAVELYNGHLWTADPVAQRRNLLAAIMAHFEARKPIDKLATVTGAAGASSPSQIQIIKGKGNRVSGRDFYDQTSTRPSKKK
ncbi:MAG: helix-turn-helix domain-containing protein [Acidobacteriota bacterium]